MGFFSRLVNGLKNTKKSFGEKLKYVFTGNEIDEIFFEELEMVLISADIGAYTTEEILERLRDEIKEHKIKKTEDSKNLLKKIHKGLRSGRNNFLAVGLISLPLWILLH